MNSNDWDSVSAIEPNPTRHRDPVCGMLIEPRHSAGTRMTRGESVFFCSTLCLEKFDSNPDHYLDESARSTTQDEIAR